MRLRLSTLTSVLAVASSALCAQAQNPGASQSPLAVPPTTVAAPAPSFDVATIKPSPSEEPTSWIGIRNMAIWDRCSICDVAMLVQRAYGLLSTTGYSVPRNGRKPTALTFGQR